MPRAKQPLPIFIALLRGINVGGNNKIPMTRLREMGEELGWQNVQTYIQSGNVVLRAKGTPAKVEQQLEDAIKEEVGLSISVIVRDATAWATYAKKNPFPNEAASTPNFLHLCLSKSKPNKDAVKLLQEKAAAGEQIKFVGDALYIHFAGGVGKSKLTPTILDRAVGSPVTARNWRTVLKLAELSAASD